jgi:FkbM family methyltransferase
MTFNLILKNLALRLLPEVILQQLRKAHYARKLVTAAAEPEMAILRHLVPAGGCAIDLGANFGSYTKMLAEAVGEAGTVYAIEPIPSTYKVLRSNLDRLGLANVEAFPVAVSDKTNFVEMAVPRYPSGGPNYYEARIGGTHGTATERFRVTTIRLDDVFADLHRIDAIKCDVEGHELSVLRGAENLLCRHHPAWLMELSGNPDDPSSPAAEVVARMRAEGYEIYRFDGQVLRPRVRRDRAVNYFFLRPEHLGRLPQELKTSTSGHTPPA